MCCAFAHGVQSRRSVSLFMVCATVGCGGRCLVMPLWYLERGVRVVRVLAWEVSDRGGWTLAKSWEFPVVHIFIEPCSPVAACVSCVYFVL